MSGVCSSPAQAICETIQVLLAGVTGGFARGTPVFAHLLIGPSHMRCNNLEMNVKLNYYYYYYYFFLLLFFFLIVKQNSILRFSMYLKFIKRVVRFLDELWICH